MKDLSHATPQPQPTPQNPQLPTSPDFEQKEQFVTINEFSTGLNDDGTYYSRGFTTAFMHATEKNIPKEVLDIVSNLKIVGSNNNDKPAMAIQEINGYSFLTTTSIFKDEYVRSLDANRYFYTPKTDSSLENILANAAKFDPTNKYPDPNKPALSDQSLENNKQLITQNEAYITDAVNSFVLGTPVLISPINPPAPIVVIEIAKRISKKFNLPLSAAINVKAVENPNSFLVILPLSSSDANTILSAINSNSNVKPDTYETYKIDDTIKYFSKAVPSKNQNAESLAKKENFATYMQNFNTKIWPDIQNNPGNLQNLMKEFEKFGLTENIKTKRFNYDIQNLIMLAAIFDPNNYLNRVKTIISSPLTTNSKGLFGNKEVVDSINSKDMKDRALIYLESLKQGFIDQTLKNRCQDLINTLQQTKF